MKPWRLVLVLAGMTGGVAACAGGCDGGETTTRACAPGTQAACACGGDRQGFQVCREDGSGFDACQGCAAVASSGGGGSSAVGNSSSAGVGSSSAGTGASSTAAGSSSTTTASSMGMASSTGGCRSNAQCAFPLNVCDVATGQCVECLETAQCAGKPGTVCGLGVCRCPEDRASYCAPAGMQTSRCVDLQNSAQDCGACGHACFDTCSAGACVNPWEPLPGVGAPLPRVRHVAVWTGTRMLVWGGVAANGAYLNDGAAFDPATGRWTPMARFNAPPPREAAAAAWNGTQLLIWGGRDANGPLGDGAAYDPVAGTWSTLPAAGAPSARYHHSAVWAPGTPGAWFIWGGFDGTNEQDTGAWLESGTWHTMTTTGAPTRRRLHAAAWDSVGQRLLIHGGLGFDPGSGTITSLATGAVFMPDATGGAWTDIPLTAGAPTGRYSHTAVMDGARFYVWGGLNNALGLLSDGALWFQGGWITIGGVEPAARRMALAVYDATSHRALVFGGYGPGNSILAQPALLDTHNVTWLSTVVPAGPPPGSEGTMVLAGNKALVWGGFTTGPMVQGDGAALDLSRIP